MKRRWKIAVSAVVIVAVVAAIALAARDSEPEYKGRTLSEWISAYSDAYAKAYHETKTKTFNAAKSSEPAQALRAMAPQILPILIRWISYEKSPVVADVESFIEPVADKIGTGERYSLFIHRRENRTYNAMAVFEVLGTNATPAIPQLSNMVMNPKLDAAARSALVVLRYIGTNGTKTILALLNNPDNPHKSITLAVLGDCNYNDRDLIEDEVRKRLEDPDERIRRTATNVLRNIRGALQEPQF